MTGEKDSQGTETCIYRFQLAIKEAMSYSLDTSGQWIPAYSSKLDTILYFVN